MSTKERNKKKAAFFSLTTQLEKPPSSKDPQASQQKNSPQPWRAALTRAAPRSWYARCSSRPRSSPGGASFRPSPCRSSRAREASLRPLPPHRARHSPRTTPLAPPPCSPRTPEGPALLTWRRMPRTPRRLLPRLQLLHVRILFYEKREIERIGRSKKTTVRPAIKQLVASFAALLSHPKAFETVFMRRLLGGSGDRASPWEEMRHRYLIARFIELALKLSKAPS